MSNPTRTCKCGSTNIRILKTSECSKCYQARRREENPEAFRKAWRKDKAERYVPAERPQEPRTAPQTETTYNGAHLRLRRYRGYASTHVCECGKPAQEWSYRGGSSFEQTGLRPQRKNGETIYLNSVWSGSIADYDPMCTKCHKERDAA